MSRVLTICFLAALITWAGAGDALAHKVMVYVELDGDQLKGEGYFSGGGKPKNCLVEVFDATGKKLAEAHTDQKGAFTLPLPASPPPLTVVLNAGEGHRAEYTLSAEEMGVSPGEAPSPAPPASVPESQTKSDSSQVAVADLANTLDTVLKKRLAPLNARLERLERGNDQVGVKEVMGGLGWILGLMGVALYFMSRRRSPRE